MTTPTNGEITQTLAQNVPIPEDDLYDQLASILSENFQTSIEKNDDYGDFRTAVEFAVSLGIEDDPVDANLEKLYSGATEKHTRFGKQALGGGDNFVGEDLLETALDNINYWLYIAWVCKHGHDYYGVQSDREFVTEVDEAEPPFETAADKCDFDDGETANDPGAVYDRIKEEPGWGEVENVLEWVDGYRTLSQGITGEDLIYTMRLTDGDVCMAVDFTRDDHPPSYATYDGQTGDVLYSGPVGPGVKDVNPSFVDTWVDVDHIDVTPVLRAETPFEDSPFTSWADNERRAIADGGW